MTARVPLDVDLEDKILYGLTPMRLTYLIVAILAAFAVWSPHWAPVLVRAVLAILIATAGVAAAWGRWRGRAADGWIVDCALFVATNFRVVANARRT